MKTAVLEKITNVRDNPQPLSFVDVPDPVPGKRQILIRVSACGVCHTELDEIEGRTPPSSFPFILGHQIVGVVKALGPQAMKFSEGQRVGIGWIGSACGKCPACKRGLDNLCRDFKATGRDLPGGYAQYVAYLVFNHIDLRVCQVYLVYNRYYYKAMLLCQVKIGDCLGLHALSRVYDQ